ncbi:MAG: hypothetical protein LBF54_00980 [Holosporaceae bacterium]|nr:hypothetical protein [Holosporaceae bacterium]
MSFKGKILAIAAFGCLINVSKAMGPYNPAAVRIISVENVAPFVDECFDIMFSEKKEYGYRLRECHVNETQLEKIGGQSIVCPQIFSCDGEFIVKVTKNRGKHELESAKRIHRHLSEKGTRDEVNLVYPELYATFKNGQLDRVKHISGFSQDEVREDDWVFEFMIQAPGVPFATLLNTTDASVLSNSDIFLETRHWQFVL